LCTENPAPIFQILAIQLRNKHLRPFFQDATAEEIKPFGAEVTKFIQVQVNGFKIWCDFGLENLDWHSKEKWVSN
jgi:hypothetical protein